MHRDDDDIELKFDGGTIAALGGAPAETVINALSALQRIAYLIGMKTEGRAFGQRAKPSTSVRRELAIICKAPIPGSHIQPVTLGSRAGEFSAEAFNARRNLLEVLDAFNSGDEDSVRAAIPDPRERWFLAQAATGLVPDEASGIQLTIRTASADHFNFRADKARSVIESLRSGGPPKPGKQRILFNLRAIDFTNSTVVLKPSEGKIVRIQYPALVEQMLQANPRKRIFIKGQPSVNAAGYLIGFDEIDSIGEFGPTAYPLFEFMSDGKRIATEKPIHVAASYEYEDRLFVFQDASLGVDAWAESYEDLLQSVLDELDVLWRNYALAPDEDLAADAIEIKRTLNGRFKVIADDA